jgi:methylmalonyl-CoA/ethylmalonyl-CoA epimerase
MAATRIHHLNFVVRDLEAAARHFESMLGVEPFVTVDHAPRGAKVARSRIGESWLVLVCPYDASSVPGKFLAKHGEGFFMLSIGTDSLEADLERLLQNGIDSIDKTPRAGILDWDVADVEESYSAIFQLARDE